MDMPVMAVLYLEHSGPDFKDKVGFAWNRYLLLERFPDEAIEPRKPYRHWDVGKVGMDVRSVSIPGDNNSFNAERQERSTGVPNESRQNRRIKGFRDKLVRFRTS